MNTLAAQAPARGQSKRVALVTGAASGLGDACVGALRDRGYRVAALDLDATGLEADYSTACDVSDVDATAAAVERVVAELGGLDAVAHCAGIFPDRALPMHALAKSTWDRTIAVNLTGSFAVARAVMPPLGERRGSLVLVASAAAEHPHPGALVYGASKAGVVALARGLALEYAHKGVRVNSISPGWIDTPMAAPVLGRDDLRAGLERRVPLGRVAEPAEIAAAIAWLLSPDAGYVTGQDLAPDGGMALGAYVEPGEVDAVWRRVAPKEA